MLWSSIGICKEQRASLSNRSPVLQFLPPIQHLPRIANMNSKVAITKQTIRITDWLNYAQQIQQITLFFQLFRRKYRGVQILVFHSNPPEFPANSAQGTPRTGAASMTFRRLRPMAGGLATDQRIVWRFSGPWGKIREISGGFLLRLVL